MRLYTGHIYLAVNYQRKSALISSLLKQWSDLLNFYLTILTLRLDLHLPHKQQQARIQEALYVCRTPRLVDFIQYNILSEHSTSKLKRTYLWWEGFLLLNVNCIVDKKKEIKLSDGDNVKIRYCIRKHEGEPDATEHQLHLHKQRFLTRPNL